MKRFLVVLALLAAIAVPVGAMAAPTTRHVFTAAESAAGLMPDGRARVASLPSSARHPNVSNGQLYTECTGSGICYTYKWNSGYAGWIDVYCNGNQNWQMDFFPTGNFGNDPGIDQYQATRLCTAHNNFNAVPVSSMMVDNFANCAFYYDCILNDITSSLIWATWDSSYGGDWVQTCDRIRTFTNSEYDPIANWHNHKGPQGSIAHTGSVASIGNDTLSSVKRVNIC